MRSVSIGIVILTLLVGSAAILALNGVRLDLSFLNGLTSSSVGTQQTADRSGETAPVERAAAEIAALGDLAGGGQGDVNTSQKVPSFDVVRIDPDGTSVFAGRANSSEEVSVMAGGIPIGTAKADAAGNWVLVTERRIPDPNAELKIVKGAIATEAQPNPKTDAAALGTKTYGGKASASAVNQQMIASLEQMIETARGKASDPTAAAAGTSAMSSQGSAATMTSTPTEGRLPPGSATGAAAGKPERQAADASQPDATANQSEGAGQIRGAQSKSIPIPIQFVYREATFTEQGQKAVSLLLEYLLVTKPQQVTLTGHADERGSPDLNMKLSLERLQTVRDFVRAGGYTGELNMTPKGETEPYQGVDRSRYPREDLFTLDRRVELRLDG